MGLFLPMVLSGPELLPRPMSGSVALLQSEFALMSLISVTTEGQELLPRRAAQN